MTHLPPLLAECTVPQFFSPSQIASAEHCALRAVLGSARNVPALRSHPAALLGSAFHKLLEMAVNGDITRASSPAFDANRTLESLLDQANSRLASDWPPPAPRLQSILPPVVWRRKRRIVLDLAERYLTVAVPKTGSWPGYTTVDAGDLPTVGSWPEVRLEAPELRLAGRADMIQRSETEVTIRDLKTGRVLTDDGAVLPHIERQMRLYGAIARRVWPDSHVHLIVDDGTENIVAFDTADEAEVVDWLASLLDRMSVGARVPAVSLATPGEGCEGCAHRHICPSYRAAAPEYWKDRCAVRMPLDTWGDIVDITTRSNDQCDLTLNDAAGRKVKIFALVRQRLGTLTIGDRVWLFGLRTHDRRHGPYGWRHPRNFFEISDDDRFAHAWTVELFTGPETS